MNKTTFFVAFLLLAGFCFAGGPPPCQYGDYSDERLDLSWCMMGVANELADDIADYGGDGDGWDLYDDMADARDAMWAAVRECNLAAFNAAYVDFMTSFNEMRFMYFYYGFTEGVPMEVLWSDHMSYMQDFSLCANNGYVYVYDDHHPK